MSKYLTIFRLSLAKELVYKLNFFMSRFRNIVQILVFFFLWTSLYENNNTSFFGYTKEMIIAYTFLLILIRSIVLMSKANDVAGMISSGDLSNFLLKPLNFIKSLIARDISIKSLNIVFSFIEITVLFLILKPSLFIQTNPVQLVFFAISLLIASIIFFNLLMLTNSVTFWIPELAWGAQFLVIMIFVEFLSGAFFPLDVFPKPLFEFLKLTPFPYLIFIPIKTYLGNEGMFEIIKNLTIGGIWAVITWLLMNKVWNKGLKVYESSGR